MAARIRQSRHFTVLAAVLAIVTVTLVAVGSFPAQVQAQGYYSYPYQPYRPYYGPYRPYSPYYGPCVTFYIGGVGLTTCSNPYSYGPYYGPYYGPRYYYRYPVPPYYHYGGPERNHEGGH